MCLGQTDGDAVAADADADAVADDVAVVVAFYV